MTKAVQQTAVGEGFALGCVALGRHEFNGSKLAIVFAFIHAWRDWSYRSRFPAIRAGHDRNDLLSIISKSPRRRSPHLAGWVSEWPFVPYIADAWSPEEVADLLAPEAEVPLGGWVQLVKHLLEDLDAQG